jgi:hypothetical protein
MHCARAREESVAELVILNDGGQHLLTELVSPSNPTMSIQLLGSWVVYCTYVFQATGSSGAATVVFFFCDFLGAAGGSPWGFLATGIVQCVRRVSW